MSAEVTEMSARANLAMEPEDLNFSALEAGLKVDLIATYDPVCCSTEESLEGIATRRELQEFDYIPVKDDGGHVVGLLERTADHKSFARLAGEAMEPLHASMIISADTSVLSYVAQASERPCRLVLRDSKLDGVVTVSDLQKLPVRPALFLVVTHLELLMAEWVRSRYCEDEWFGKLSGGRQNSVNEKWKSLTQDNLALDKLSATEFCDKRELIKKLYVIEGKKCAERELKEIEHLRNIIAHAGDYALTPETAEKTIRAVQLAQKWIADLRP